MRVTAFDYDLPRELIAQHPLPRRDDSLMMIVDRKRNRIQHHRFKDLAGFFDPGDLIVLNDTRVFPARAWGSVDGRDVEFLFIEEISSDTWQVLCRPARRVRKGMIVRFSPKFAAEVTGIGEEGQRTLRCHFKNARSELRRIGFAPLPPYIDRKRRDAARRLFDIKRYQTVYADKEAAVSVAAPTAGLHFTKDTLDRLRGKRVELASITLEVGWATFQPIRTENVEDHQMLHENYEISQVASKAIHSAVKSGRLVCAVGTTVVRALESAWSGGRIHAGRRETDLFIYPGFPFNVVDRLLTNFHLPQSTLLMLVCAFAGKDLILRAYREAVQKRYRFFSYGDCMLIL